ncbi:glycosyltransferase family 2 protein [Microvirga ossetica]|uniref:glycosyltransferase family 2 protein n=1 Tax=Microvirga ossetica TaxID=1882682 RepID=UPI000C1472D2|nr:glycosyltransferase family 2 protein [Microvirga ossetica]
MDEISQSTTIELQSPIVCPIELSLVVPTFNEVDNILPLIEKVECLLDGTINWELIFVDDNSPDGTSETVRAIAQRNRHIRVVQRVGRRGLSSAVVEGILASSASVIGVMDADMQHDENILPLLWKAVAQDGFDLAVASRYADGGGMGEWNQRRQSISRGATWLATFVLKVPVSDPMSGFFVISRQAFMASLPKLSTIGFKILVDILASAPRRPSIKEVPYEFRARKFGSSKLDSAVEWEYIVLLTDKLLGRFFPIRFILFSFVGSIGVIVHLSALGVSLNLFGMRFIVAQSIAVLTAMTFNFLVNNFLTYRDRRLRGVKLLYGLFSFYVVCLIGAAANVGVGAYIYNAQWTWWLAGIAGAAVGAVWNYAVSAAFTWKK